MELLIGGVAAVGTGIFTNPLEVVKIRLQLQGELQARGQYAVHYKNVFHAAYVIAKNDGIIALQKGLVPALWFQLVMNGTRLGTYQIAEKRGWIRRKDADKVDPLKSLAAGAICGVVGAVLASPFYLVKTHLQARSNKKGGIAVGHQHNYKGMNEGFRNIYGTQGVKGLWRGSSSAIPRVAVASAIQLTTFEKFLEYVRSLHLFPPHSWMNAFCASFVSGFFVAAGMAPFDLVATRFYNQGVDSKGRGILYKNILECVQKIYKEERFWGFYKGWTVNYFRIGPHTLILLVFWDRLKYYHELFEQRKGSRS